MKLRALACFLLLAALFVTGIARAQGKPEVRFSADATTVAVGDIVTLTLEAQSSSGMPSDPQLGAIGSGLRVVIGPSLSTSTSIQIMNGVTLAKRGLTTNWQLRAQQLGKQRVGPASVTVGGTRYTTPALTITVVDAAHAPRRTRPQQQQQQNPFDPFGGMFNFGQTFDAPQAAPEPSVDPRLSLDAARDGTAFLHATVDKTNVVVGEQVTFTVLLYVDAMTREPDFNDVHESTAADFLKRSLRDDDSRADVVGTASVGGRLWSVKMVRKSALFPLKTGDLEIGPMTLAIAQAHGDPSGQRQSESLRIHVTEPPAHGRPPGYALGDVGRFDLATEVEPRTLERDGAIGVTVTLSGTGNLPSQLTPPQRPGVEWLEPQMHEKVGAVQGDTFGGRRTFAYVVRVHKEGDVDLGDLVLPYWDPEVRSYKVARAALGVVHVTPGAGPAQQAEAPPDPLPGLPAPRATRGAIRASTRHLSDSPWLWGGLGAPAIAFGLALGGTKLARRVRDRRAQSAASPEADLRARMLAAEQASNGGDAGALDAATARALEAATIAHAGVNVRGIGTSQIAARLEESGVIAETAREVQEILRACDSARFGAGADAAEAKGRWTRARAAIERLAR